MVAPVVSGPLGGKGLALVLGWTGGMLKHVRKHEKMWHDIGWRTATLDMPIDSTFFPPDSKHSDLSQRCEALLAAVEREATSPSTLIVPHVFSNGGAMLLLQAVAAAEKRPGGCALSLDGVVFDSAPSPVSHLRPLAALVVIASSGLPPRELAAKLVLHVPHAVASECRRPFVEPPHPFALFPTLASLPSPRNLFLYSKGDRLVPSSSVEAFAGEKRRLGAGVTLGRFAASPHCGHFVAHPAEYTRQLQAWANDLPVR